MEQKDARNTLDGLTIGVFLMSVVLFASGILFALLMLWTGKSPGPWWLCFCMTGGLGFFMYGCLKAVAKRLECLEKGNKPEAKKPTGETPDRA